MKKSTKVLIAVFIVAAVALYISIYGVPGVKSMFEKTEVLEYGDLPVLDEVEVCIVRDETLYRSSSAGTIEYLIDEGAKVRGGVNLLRVTGGAPPEVAETATPSSVGEEDEAAALARVSATAGEGAAVTPDNVSPFTAMVSYFADGYEKIFAPAAIETMTKASVSAVPADCVSLRRIYAGQGEPIYKLTDNNLWYMVYWIDAASFKEDDPKASAADRDGYAVGKSVRVNLGSTEISAVIQSYTPEGSDMKVVLRSDMYYRDMQKYRKVIAEVVFAEHRGLIVDEANVIVRDGAPGVFVKQINGEFKWTRVQYVKDSNGRHTVSVGTFSDEEGKLVRTVKYYDEILVDPAAQGYS
ncbi:MAG: hypothetical protein LBL63_04120 [Clostridiales Family XIII bacterium]|jgi:hypothetical protein|nr:hypothetical protein [Clostridiales Family XIII bacterium]